MKTFAITCDACQRDLRQTDYEQEYRLALTAEPMGHDPRYPVFSMSLPAEIDSCHFCNLRCLSTWLAARTAPRAHLTKSNPTADNPVRPHNLETVADSCPDSEAP